MDRDVLSASANPAGRAPAAAPPQCPNCSQAALSGFYRVGDIPVHSCLLMETRRQALSHPTGDLELGLCPACGFIANTLFDGSGQDYNRQYEETQAFSDRFNVFLVSLVRRLIERYGIRGKKVLEIGCGKGEFLCLLCQLGDNQGIGIDPACVPQRIPDHVADRVTIITDYYSRRYAHLTADVVCCRHTLEHIPRTADFLRLLRRSLTGRGDALVFFEVPDTFRVLRQGAFWDVYYEHCSYFTPGSLARLFRTCGFEIDQLYLDYGGQYIMLTARPADGPTRPRLEIEDDLAGIAPAVDAFRAAAEKAVRAWRKFILNGRRRGRRGVIWGSGSKGVAFLTTLKLGGQIEYVVDINPYRQGKFMPATAQRIIAPRRLADYKPDYVVAMNPIYRQEIQRELDRMQLQPKLLSL